MIKRVVCWSGGLNSTAMLLGLIEFQEPFNQIVFCDTDNEIPALYPFIDAIIQRYNLNVTVTHPPITFDEYRNQPRTKGSWKGIIRGPPLPGRCYWAELAKIRVLNRICKGQIALVGYTVNERPRLKLRKRNYELEFPLIRWGWTSNDCRQFLEKHHAVPPIYDMGFTRSGCWFCPNKNTLDLEALRHYYPGLYERYCTLYDKEED